MARMVVSESPSVLPGPLRLCMFHSRCGHTGTHHHLWHLTPIPLSASLPIRVFECPLYIVLCAGCWGGIQDEQYERTEDGSARTCSWRSSDLQAFQLVQTWSSVPQVPEQEAHTSSRMQKHLDRTQGFHNYLHFIFTHLRTPMRVIYCMPLQIACLL